MVAEVTEAAPQNLAQAEASQEFYVLENGYQQVVFSTVGGAIAEINLPFESKEFPYSVVKKIQADKQVEHYSPENEYFPLFPYSRINKETGNVEKTSERTLGGYYPLLRRSIVGVGRDRSIQQIEPKFYSCNIVSSDPKTADILYKVTKFTKNQIEFEGSDGYRRIIKTFSFPEDSKDSPYCIQLTVKIDGDARGLWMTSGIPEVELISDSFSPAVKYCYLKGKKMVVDQISLPKTSTSFSSLEPEWVCNSNGFFGIIMDPLFDLQGGFTAFNIPGKEVPTRMSLIDPGYNLYPAEKYPGYEVQLPLKTPKTQKLDFRIIAGPFDDDILQRLDITYTNNDTGYNPNYVGSQSYHGWFSFISEPFADFLFMLMKLFYKVTSSWGISIILLTIALRIMLYPLNAWSIKSTLAMQKIAPQVTAIQEKYKKDPKKAQMEVIKLYQEKKINPLTGCFPILIQMPFLIGMFDLLKSAFEIRGAVFIPGWITNLTAPDVLFSWNYPIFFFGTEFHALPILLGGVMYLQQRYSSSAPKDKNLLTDQQKQQKMMGNIMTIVFTVMFYHFPSGLNIYWLSSMLLGILQQWIMNRKIKANAR